MSFRDANLCNGSELIDRQQDNELGNVNEPGRNRGCRASALEELKVSIWLQILTAAHLRRIRILQGESSK